MRMTTTASGCPFCKISSHDAPADVVHDSDKVMAFRDINPKAPTHILVIPKDHIESAAHLSKEHAGLLVEMFAAASHLAKAEGIDRTGWRLVTNVGNDSGQSISHLHFHLLGGRRMAWPPG